MISFDQIPNDLRTPGVYTEINSSRAVSGAQLLRYRVLLIGQKLQDGAASPLVPVRVTHLDTARGLFGAGSMLATMVEAALAQGGTNELWALPLQDADEAVASQGAIALAGQANAAGTLSIYIAGKACHVAVAAGDTAEELAAKLHGALDELADLPVVVTGLPAPLDALGDTVVQLQARHRGEAGDDIDIRLNLHGEPAVPGITTTITAMSGGARNPDVRPAIAALGDDWFQVWALPYTNAANLVEVENELADRFDAMREIEGHAFAAARGTLAELSALGTSRNSPHVSIVAAGSEPMPPWAKAAETAAIAARYASLDPARPLKALPYRYCLPPAEIDRQTLQERNLLLFDGIATTTVEAGGVMVTERLITTYRRNAAGAVDTAYLDVETLFTLSTLRHDWKNYLLTKYPRHKVGNDGVRFAPGQAVVTPGLIKAEAVSKFREWEELGLVENFDQFRADLIVERNAADPSRIDVLLPPDLINGLRILATQIQFRL
ncbi:phage tail sheath C-terminal domain-containing protein [Lysobacter sp. LF1]|uniref:Phage tail sheath C-terminal domain-containing protein n=1 Tax=Lysobacter stagni TaxID=3045172 RepID=A0ABT6XLC1_9GAMM|nr:phage tail sheath C-terminal domain-containing protein [Lysobacter sp. LF1]MDI9240738.1 phage tail sheath C-terminal domain-containing protein [Lysobacter sp. LF1]